jgi:hypothetical protein
MPKTITADFRSRRDAEMAVEHIVQEHDVDRKAVSIGPALRGKVRVSVQVDDANADKVMDSIETFHGEKVS